MEVDLESLLDIALGGPEIGPLNLQVLHGLMKEVFQRMNLSNQNILVEEDGNNFSNSFNFVKSKMNEKSKRPRTAGGGCQKFKSQVSVIVSDYVRDPIASPNEGVPPSRYSADIDDRLRYIESELKHAKDFPSVDELRTWAKEKTTPDTVVTDLWQFVSLNHRVSGLEEGIRRLSTLVDKLIPELKSLGEEQNVVNGKIDDLYSQFRGLSDRLTYIDSKLDSEVNNITALVETKVHEIYDTTKQIERRFKAHPKYPDLEHYVTVNVFNEIQEKARGTVQGIREELGTKLNYSVLEKMASQDDLQNFVDILNSLDTKMVDCAMVGDLNKFVTNTQFADVAESCHDMEKHISSINVTLAGKADVSAITEFALKDDIDKLSARVEVLNRGYEDQSVLALKLDDFQSQLNKKAENSDVIDVLKKEDMKKTLSRVQSHQGILNELQHWQKMFVDEENPALQLKLNELTAKTVDMSELLKYLNDECEKRAKEDVFGLQDLVLKLGEKFTALESAYQSNLSSINGTMELKLNKTELQPLKDYLENCYAILTQQYEESNVSHCGHHAPSRPKSGIPSINVPRKSGCSSCDTYVSTKNDGAIIRTQLKYNCLSCNQPLRPSSSQYQTVRGKPLSSYELDHLKVLQKMLGSNESDERSCGGKYTASPPMKKNVRESSAFANQEGIMIDGEVDIEGLDGKLYRGLISRKDFVEHHRCKSANDQLRTVSPQPGSRVERPISAKNLESKSFNLPRATAYS